MKEQNFKLDKRRIDKLCKQFKLKVKYKINCPHPYKVSYYCKGQDILAAIEFSRRNILCWISTGVNEVISPNQFYKVYQIMAEVQKYENS